MSRAAAVAGALGAVVACGLGLAGTAPAAAAAEDAPPSAERVRRLRVRWLAENASPVRSIAPEDEDFSDLAPLAAALGDARVVMLGEATHGDGETFRAKARLVRFLHRELGLCGRRRRSDEGCYHCLH